MSLAKRLGAEALGTALLLAIVVGSGIMAEQLAGGNVALALLANALATAAGLYALITVFGPLSGAQFNPLVSLALAATGQLPWRELPGHVIAQLAGALAGVWIAHGMFGLPLLQWSTHARAGLAQGFSEMVASFGLLLVILGCLRHRAEAIPQAVALWIVAAYWFTASTSFANPAVTIARACTDSFAGIRPQDVPGFIAAQLLGLALVLLVQRVLFAPPDAASR